MQSSPLQLLVSWLGYSASLPPSLFTLFFFTSFCLEGTMASQILACLTLDQVIPALALARNIVLDFKATQSAF